MLTRTEGIAVILVAAIIAWLGIGLIAGSPAIVRRALVLFGWSLLLAALYLVSYSVGHIPHPEVP